MAKIFISYSWTPKENKYWVEKLARRLLKDGVDVILDIWELKVGHDIISYMEVIKRSDIDYVIVICNKDYQEKANKKEKSVGIESQIISKEVYENIRQEKFIPIVKEYINGIPTLPFFFENRLYLDFSTSKKLQNNYEKLLRVIHKVIINRKPKIGEIPEQIIENKNSNDGDLILEKGINLIENRSFDIAIKYFKEQQKLCPNNPDYYFYYSFALLRSRRPKVLSYNEISKIVSDLEIAIKLEPKSIYHFLYAYVGYDFFKLNGFDEKGRDFKSMLNKIKRNRMKNVEKEFLIKNLNSSTFNDFIKKCLSNYER